MHPSSSSSRPNGSTVTEQLQMLIASHMQDSPAAMPNTFPSRIREHSVSHNYAPYSNGSANEMSQAVYSFPPSQNSSSFVTQQQPPLYYPPPTMQYNAAPSYHYSPPSVPSRHLRPIRPTQVPRQSSLLNPHPPQSRARPRIFSQSPPRQPLHAPTSIIPPRSIHPTAQRYPVPQPPQPPHIATRMPPSAPPPPAPTLIPNTPKHHASMRPPTHKIVHRPLPFYNILACIYERQKIFRYDVYRKKYISHDEFILPFDVCNQLALSSDYDSVLNSRFHTKHLLLRLVRIDQPPTYNGKFEDNLPVNVEIQVNGTSLNNLPLPKPCTRQYRDLLRPGREINITSHCIFNPMLQNDITIMWTYRPDNKNVAVQYVNADYALHVFLAERLTVAELCERVLQKPEKFFDNDLMGILLRARNKDSEGELEVSIQKLKLVCPIDQKRLKIPARATTCQHLQCFDLTNYIALNEKSNKWMCPACNKPAAYEDLQVDYFTDSILKAIETAEITEISIDSNLRWTPIIPLDSPHEPIDSKAPIRLISSSSDVIFLDED